MPRCHTCGAIRARFMSVPKDAGRFGKLLTVFISGWMALDLWRDGNQTYEPVVVLLPHLLGQTFAAVWMTLLAIEPLIGIGSGSVRFRVVGATLALATWTVLLIQMLAHGDFFDASVGSVLLCIIATLTADIKLAHQVAAHET